MTTCDVAVVGGGILGTSTAAFLAAEGLSVTLVEATAIAARASGRNSGVIQRPFDAAYAPLYRRTLELYRALEAERDGSFRLPAEPVGLLYLSFEPAALDAVAAEFAAAMPDLAVERLAAGEATRLEPAVTEAAAALHLPIGYPVMPAAATLGYGELARRRGVSIVLGSSAELVREGDEVRGVRTEVTTISAGVVVVAAGPWSPAVIDPTGAWRPIRPLWGVVADVALERPPGRVLEEAGVEAIESPRHPPRPGSVPAAPLDDAAIDGGRIFDAHGPLDAGAGPTPADLPGLSFSLVSAAGRSSLGSTFLDREPEPLSYLEALRRRGARFVPALAATPARSIRTCARPLALDGRPLLGAVPGVAGLFVVAGHGPWGMSTGPASARLVADLVLGRPVTVPPELDAARFGAP